MKTLKNRPHFVSEKYGKIVQKKGKEEAFRLCLLETEEWFEDFEKQETKRLSDTEFAQMDLSSVSPFTVQRRAYYEGYIKAKQEVLGE